MLAKSDGFRKRYWTPLYVVKAVEYINRRLLGRPTYGRSEMNGYYDICAKQGFYGLVESMVRSQEYCETFGEDTVPYERYVTPAGLALRSLRPGSTTKVIDTTPIEPPTPRFIELGTVLETRAEPDIQSRMNQGVTVQRQQTKIFKLTDLKDKPAVKQLVGAAYRQVFERDVEPYVVRGQFTALESKLSNGQISVKEFIEGIGCSELYIKEFYTPYPNTKVIELGTKHFLGRAPENQKEIQKYNQILASSGIRGFVSALVNSMEYLQVFNEDTVPYRRFPTLPAANFPNTEKLYNKQTKQNAEVVVPSFAPVSSRLDVAKLPLTGKAIADIAAKEKPAFVELSRSIPKGSEQMGVTTALRQPARIVRLTPGSNSTETSAAINAIYTQVLDITGDIPQDYRLPDLDQQLLKGEISVRQFVKALATSEIYRGRFYSSYPANKVVELLFRHLLGRTPATQTEIQDYTKLMAERGLNATVTTIVDSSEYARFFGEYVVPYPRVPTLIAGNYLGSVKA